MRPSGQAGQAKGTELRSNLALYYGARFVGQVAHNLFIASLLIFAGTSSHSAMGLSSLIIAMAVSSIIFGLPGGALSDRLAPGRGFAVGSIGRAAVILVAVLIHPSAAVLVGLAFVYAGISQVHGTSEMALVKDLCHRSPGRVHSLLVAMQYAGQAAGFLVFAPVLYYFGGAEAALAGSFVLMLIHSAMANVLAARLRTMARTVRDAGPGRFAGLRQTVAFFGRSAPARDALAVNAVKALVTQVILVAFPLYLKQDLSLGNQGALLLLAPGIAGAALGLAWAATGLSLEGTARAMRLSIAGLTVAVLALASLDYGVSAAFVYSQVPPLVHFEAGLNLAAIVGMPVAFLIGASLSVAVVSSRAALTAAAPVAIQSRAFAVQSTASDALMVLPLLFAGVLAEVLGARMTLAALGAVSGVAWLMVWHPRFQLRLFVRSAESGV